MFGGWRSVSLPDATVTELASNATRAYLGNATAMALHCNAPAHPKPAGKPNVTEACSQVRLRHDNAGHETHHHTMIEGRALQLELFGTRHAQVVSGMNYELFWTANVLCSPDSRQTLLKLHAQYYVPLRAPPMLQYVEQLGAADLTKG